MSDKKLRIGILGAARIVPMALLERRQPLQRGHLQDPQVLNSYEELLADPSIDAIYNPLPNSLHAVWTIRALEANKHVLCEKPFTSNADEAQQVAEASKRTGRVAMEAFHWRSHPLAERMGAVVASGELGTVRRIETDMCIPLPLPGNIRYRLDLGGGATMDTGSYAISMLRHLASAEPTVEHAEARLSSPGVDRWMRARMQFADGRTGQITCSLWSSTLLRIRARVEGERGTMEALNPVAPQVFHRLTVSTGAGRRREQVRGEASYTCQLRAFAGAVLRGEAPPTGAEDAVNNMRVIDAVYRAAGLKPRGAST